MDGLYVEISMNPNDQYRLWTFVVLIRLTEQSVNNHLREFNWPAKISVSPRSSPLGTFRAEERLRLSDRNSILMTQTNVYIINPVVMGFQIQICRILRVFWSILVKCRVHLRTSSSKTQTLCLEKSIFQ